MPTRILRDGILTSERIDLLGWPEEVFYRRLMSVVDDYGRFPAHHSLIRAACYPLMLDRVSDSDVGKWLTACANAALVGLYFALDGKLYLEISDFGQRVQRKSKFPDPTGDPPEFTVNHGESPQITVNPRLVGVVVVVEGEGEVVDEKKKQKTAPVGADPLFDGVDPQVVADFRAIRKLKRAAITATALAGIKREAAKSGLSLEAALRVCCERGWAGFKSDWVGADTATAVASAPGGGRRAL